MWEPSSLGVGVSERSSWKRWPLSKILQDRWELVRKEGQRERYFWKWTQQWQRPRAGGLDLQCPPLPKPAVPPTPQARPLGGARAACLSYPLHSGRCPCCPCLSYPLHDTCPPPTLPPQGLGKCPKPHLQGPLADELIYEPLFKGTLTFSFFKKNIIHWWLHYHDCKAYPRRELGQSRKVKGNKKSPIMPATIRCPQLTCW